MAQVVICVLLSATVTVITLLGLPSTTEADYVAHTCANSTVFTTNSTFQSNLNHLFSALSSNATRDTGFYNATAGRTPTDTVYGLFLCRGDVTPAACKSCVTTATSEVVKRCPIEKQVVIWYDLCMLRYSNQSFFSTADESPGLYLWNANVTTELVKKFNQVMEASVTEVATEAASGGNKFATKEANITGLISLYSLGQCTQDLSSLDCDRCLRKAIAQVPDCCSGTRGVRILSPSCNIRFDLYPFYSLQKPTTEAPAPPPVPELAPPPAPPIKGKMKLSSLVIASIVASVVLSVLAVVVARCFFLKSRLIRARRQKNKALNDMTTVESLQFDLGTIEAATKKFSDDNKLGEGGFGQVFKGTLENGQEIAVKRLSKSSGQGVREFKNEVLLVAKLQHSRKHPENCRHLAWELWNEGKVLELMDPLLKDSCSPNEFLRYIHIGLLCVQEDANNRPTMSSVVLMLKSESIGLSKPERPAFYTGRRSTTDDGNTLVAPISCSVNVLTISDHVPR